jgi:hypothetical protein
MAYEMLAGRPPFGNGITPMAVLYAHVHQPPPPLVDLAPDTPESLRSWVEWLLSKAPEDRPASAAEAWEALEEIAVAELGPYWRRSAAVLAPAEQITTAMTTEEPTSELAPTRTQEPPARERRTRRLALLAGGVSALGAAAVAAFVLPDSGRAPPRPARAAVPFDFDGDRQQELVIGMPGSAQRERDPPGGLVVIHQGDESEPPTVITSRDARLPAPHLPRDEFGSSPQSGDFDGDGWADLAIGVPGRQLVAVMYGATGGLLEGRRDALTNRGLGGGAGSYGRRLAAGDFNGDGYADLAIGAPGDEDEGTSERGAIELVYGGPDGLTFERAHRLRRPDSSFVRFGSRLRTGHVDGDRYLDLVEGSPDLIDGSPGHGSFCRGTELGPRGCKPLGDSGTSSVAVADVDGDGFEDIVQGDHLDTPAAPGGGEIRLWRGGRRGPAREPLTIVQGTRVTQGTRDEAGDMFGYAVDARRLDADDFAEMVVSMPGENGARGGVIVIRGGRAGYALSGATPFTRAWKAIPGEPVPSESFGWTLAIVQLPGDDRPDLAVTARGAERVDDAIVILEGGPGIFSPDETEVSELPLGEAVQDPRIEAIRIARGRSG